MILFLTFRDANIHMNTFTVSLKWNLYPFNYIYPRSTCIMSNTSFVVRQHLKYGVLLLIPLINFIKTNLILYL